MVLLLNRCIGATGRWFGRPSWAVRCVGVSDISMHTGRGGLGVDIPYEGCSRTGGYGVDVAGRCRVSSMSSSGPATRTPWRKVSLPCHVIPMSVARRFPLLSMRSGQIRGCGLPASSRGCWNCQPSNDCFTSWDRSLKAMPWSWHWRRKASHAARMFALSRFRALSLSLRFWDHGQHHSVVRLSLGCFFLVRWRMWRWRRRRVWSVHCLAKMDLHLLIVRCVARHALSLQSSGFSLWCSSVSFGDWFHCHVVKFPSAPKQCRRAVNKHFLFSLLGSCSRLIRSWPGHQL